MEPHIQGLQDEGPARRRTRQHSSIQTAEDTLKQTAQLLDNIAVPATTKRTLSSTIPTDAWEVTTEAQMVAMVQERPSDLWDMLLQLRAAHDTARPLLPVAQELAAKHEKVSTELEDLTQQHSELTQNHRRLTKRKATRKQATTQYGTSIEDKTPLDQSFSLPLEDSKLETALASTYLESTKDTPNMSDKRSAKTADPPIYLGIAEPDFEIWKIQIDHKLILNDDHYPSDDKKIYYVFSRLGGEAAKHCLPRIQKSATKPFHTYQEIIDHLDTRFKDYDKINNARREYQALQQGIRSFGEFYSDMLRLVTVLDITDAQVVVDLEQKINGRLQNKLEGHQELKLSLEKLRIWLEQTDNAIRANRTRELATKPATYSKPITKTSSTIKTAPVTKFKPKVEVYTKPTGTRACFRCGLTNHLIQDCPKPDPTPKQIHEIEVGEEQDPDSDDEPDQTEEVAENA